VAHTRPVSPSTLTTWPSTSVAVPVAEPITVVPEDSAATPMPARESHDDHVSVSGVSNAMRVSFSGLRT
jgi:hypothetical protein